MIYWLQSSENIFDFEKWPVEAIVNPVNCRGISGAGLALEFKNRFPENYEEYRKVCLRGELKPGEILIVRLAKDDTTKKPKFIYNFSTKDHWKDKSRLEWIDSGLQQLTKQIIHYNIKSISIPALGCGLGGLNWIDVQKLILKHLSNFNSNKELKILIFSPI